MSDKLKCCFCGRETTVQGQRPHQKRCLYGPMGERVKAFARDYIEKHGRITTREWEKNQERCDLGLPSYMHILRRFGTWPAFISWCEVDYKRTHRRMPKHMTEEENMQRIDAMLAEGRTALESANDFRAIQAIDRGVKRLYDWRTMTYYTAHVMELK